MQTLHISKTQTAITTCKQRFTISYPKYGSGVVELTPYGEYLLTTIGVTEGSVKRSAEYKVAYNKVTNDLLHAYKNEDGRYTSIHQKMAKVFRVSYYKKGLIDLTPAKYQRSKFALHRPTKDEIEDDLRKEVLSLNFDKTQPPQVSEKDYISQHLNMLIEERQQGWQEACDLFNQIEDAREERENAKLVAEYKNIYNQKLNFIEGKEENVETALSTMCSTLSIPYNICLSYDYRKDAHLLDVKLVFENGVNVPALKAVVLASGKISIKNKLVKEMISDKTFSTLSFVYYIASHLFNVSPNIQYLRMSVYDKDKHNPLLWVEFDRNQFSRINPKTVGLHADILGYPHVLDFNTKRETLELSAMKEAQFENEVKKEIANLNSSRSVVGTMITELDDGKIAISFNDAQQLTNIPGMTALCKKAIAEAKDNGWSYVVIDKKYKGIIEELNKALGV